MSKESVILPDPSAFTRADLIKTAIVDGLKVIGENQRAVIIEETHFDYDPFRNRILAYCPRSRFALEKEADQDSVKYLEDTIEQGLKVHGFLDSVWVQP